MASAVDQQIVAIEIKAGKAGDKALGQLLACMGCLSCRAGIHRQIRGILVATDFDNRVIYACKNLPNVRLMKYTLSFTFGEVT